MTKISDSLKAIIKNPSYVIVLINKSGIRFLNDKTYIKLFFKMRLGYEPDLEHPKTFNEKLQWLKIHDRKDIYTTMVDKYEVKKYVAETIGKEYIVPTLGVYNKFDDIDFNTLPNQFVIKCTHDSGGTIICKDKSRLNIKKAKKTITKLLKRNYYYAGREWPYKNVKPRIIVEKYMSCFGLDSAVDYKFFCFNGEPNIVLVCSDRFSNDGLKETWFDSEWNLLKITEGGHEIDRNIKKPIKFKKMKLLAKKLAQNMAFVRIDFYEFDGKVYFGEITFFPASGFERFDPKKWDRIFGDMIDLNKQ